MISTEIVTAANTEDTISAGSVTGESVKQKLSVCKSTNLFCVSKKDGEFPEINIRLKYGGLETLKNAVVLRLYDEDVGNELTLLTDALANVIVKAHINQGQEYNIRIVKHVNCGLKVEKLADYYLGALEDFS